MRTTIEHTARFPMCLYLARLNHPDVSALARMVAAALARWSCHCGEQQTVSAGHIACRDVEEGRQYHLVGALPPVQTPRE